MSHGNQLEQFTMACVILRRRKEPKLPGNMATSSKNRYVKCKRYSSSGIKIVTIYFSDVYLCGTPLHTTPHHSTPLHSTPLHFTPLYTTPHHSTPLHFTSLHSTTPHHSTPLYTTPLHTTPLQSNPYFSHFISQADVLVSSATSDLNSPTVCGKALNAVGGSSFVQACQPFNNIGEGNIACTAGGNLSCKHVLHAVCCDWKKRGSKKVRN